MARFSTFNYEESCAALAVDTAGNVYVTVSSFYYEPGYGDPFYGPDYYNMVLIKSYATVKYDPDGNALWAARYSLPSGGSKFPANHASALAVDAYGNVHVTGTSNYGAGG